MHKVTIIVPHYKTLQLTKLCLRLLRQYTEKDLAKVLVVDNGSKDESTEYLRSLKWIDLLIREPDKTDTPALSHSRALDTAMEKVDTPYVLVIHTDTLVKRPDWLPFLLSHIENKPSVAGVGSWKLEFKPWYKRILKSIEGFFQRLLHNASNKAGRFSQQSTGLTRKDEMRGACERTTGVYNDIHEDCERACNKAGRFYRQSRQYLRSHCALYRTELLKKYNLSFAGKDIVAGKSLHHALAAQGYDMRFLTSEELIPYICHVNHATMALNPELGIQKNSMQKGLKRIKKTLNDLNAESILNNNTLDL